MPYPDKPDISTSYTAYEQSLGDGSLPGEEMDVDLLALRDTANAIIDFLKLFTRSDGKLANGIVTSESLSSSLRIGFDPPEPWVTGEDYTTSSTVFEGYGFYLCLTAHTAGADFTTDLNAGRWQLLADLTPPAGSLIANQNLADLADAPTARTNLGLGTMATKAAGTSGAQFRDNDQNDARFQPLAAFLTALAAAGSVGTGQLADDAVTAAKLADDSVTADQLAADAVVTAGIIDGAVTFAKLAPAAVITSSETIASNDSDTAIPTAAAVKDYADIGRLRRRMYGYYSFGVGAPQPLGRISVINSVTVSGGATLTGDVYLMSRPVGGAWTFVAKYTASGSSVTGFAAISSGNDYRLVFRSLAHNSGSPQDITIAITRVDAGGNTGGHTIKIAEGVTSADVLTGWATFENPNQASIAPKIVDISTRLDGQTSGMFE